MHEIRSFTIILVCHLDISLTQSKLAYPINRELLNVGTRRDRTYLGSTRFNNAHRIFSDRQYLLDNCVHQLKNIELEYKDDNVKIQIRENLFHAPQYLASKIKQLINALVFQTATIIFQCIANAGKMITNEHLEIEQIARKYNCQIDRIGVQTKNEIVKLPKARTTSTIKSTSTFIIQESNRFIDALPMLKRLSTSTGGIEILKTKDLTTPLVDITIISTVKDAVKEQIEPNCSNFYFETDAGRKVLFIPWAPPSIKLDNDQTETILEESIKEYISIFVTQIATLCTTDIKRIAISTTEWENYSNRKQLVEKFIHALKFQLETDEFFNRDWIILFLFNENQSDMYDLFMQTILSLQVETNDYEQFYWPISSMHSVSITIDLKTSRNYNIAKCQNAINDYVRKRILTTATLVDAFDSEIWNQHMINVYYKYCIEKFVFPKISSISEQNARQQQRLDLIGPASFVNEMKQRHDLMSEIIKQKTVVSMRTDEKIEIATFHQYPQLTLDDVSKAYNILILSCLEDEILSNRLAARLIDEGYLVHVNHSDQLSSTVESQFEKTDLVLVYFSRNYLQNEDCLAQIKQAKISEKKIISILSTRKPIEQDNNWLDSVTTTDLYYELFKEESHFKLDEDFDLEYDKLLVELLHYTKPGIVGRTYPMVPTDSNKEKQPEEVPYQQDLQPKMTVEQRRQREEIYEKDIEKIRDRDKISTDEVEKLMECLTLVIEDCKTYNLLGIDDVQEVGEQSNETTKREENKIVIGTEVINADEEAHQHGFGQEGIHTSEHQTRKYSSNSYQRRKEIYAREQAARTQRNLNNLCLCIKRWMHKASNGSIIRGNIRPFTVTGDFNDAPYPILLSNKNPWWTASAIYSDFVHSPPEIYFRYPPLIMGSWFSYNEARHYYQTLIDRDIIFRNKRQKQRRMIEKLQQNSKQTTLNKSDSKFRTKFSEVVHNAEFTTELKEGQVAWDITEDIMILKEYEKRRTRNKMKKSHENLTAWERLIERSVQLLSDMKESRIDLHSNILQGKIGNELKTEEEMRKLHELDDPNNKRWTIKRPRQCTREFLQAKIQNTIELQTLCETSTNM
ncbi:unnamed protein product [Rotaria sp. Silwood2]|nr:unnamed protein product [Rotaria sp. Silwood2]